MKRFALWSLAFVLGTAVGAGVEAQEPPPIYVLEWGGPGTGPGQFDGARGTAIDSLGHVFVSDELNHRVQVFDAEGTFLNQWGSFGSGNGQFNRPLWLEIDNADRVYVVDHMNSRVQVFDANGTFILTWGTLGGGPGQFILPWGIEVAFGKVYVADHNNNRVQVFSTDGTFLMSYGGPVGSGDGEFRNPADVGVDSDGNIYVSDWNNHRIQKFDSNFNFLAKWGNQGTGDGEFSSPRTIEVDPWDRIYVTEAGNPRVQKFNTDGTFLVQWGGYGSGPGQFTDAFGVATNTAGELFVTEGPPGQPGNHRVQKFRLPPGGYATDFESFTQGTVDGQDSWWISGVPTLDDGTIVDDGTGNLVLQVLAGAGWGDEVGRHFVPAYRRYLVAEMEFQTKDGGSPFWFMGIDNLAEGDCIFWWAEAVSTDANPGTGGFHIAQDAWHHVGLEVDQYSRQITAFRLGRTWIPVDDSGSIADPAQLLRFFYRGLGNEERLWIDNIDIAGFNMPVIVFYDSFESGDTSAWSTTVP